MTNIELMKKLQESIEEIGELPVLIRVESLDNPVECKDCLFDTVDCSIYDY